MFIYIFLSWFKTSSLKLSNKNVLLKYLFLLGFELKKEVIVIFNLCAIWKKCFQRLFWYIKHKNRSYRTRDISKNVKSRIFLGNLDKAKSVQKYEQKWFCIFSKSALWIISILFAFTHYCHSLTRTIARLVGTFFLT